MENKLNPVAQKWVEALRSGKYTQAHGQLANGERTAHCCLGVLCELAVKEGIISEYSDMSKFLPVSVARWAGLATTKAEYGQILGAEDMNGTDALWKDNDGTGVTRQDFNGIANIIESKPTGLFVE